MNIGLHGSNLMSIGQGIFGGGGLMKSTLQRMERQADRDRQVALIENQKQNLKNINCSSAEEVSRILDLLHSYEDQIAAVKAEYNNAQMFHLMDEAMEKGEKIAEAIEKSAPKTAEERKKEAVEEALGIDEEKGLLRDVLEKISDEALPEDLEDISEMEAKTDFDQEPTQAAESSALEPEQSQTQEALPEPPIAYKRFDAFA